MKPERAFGSASRWSTCFAARCCHTRGRLPPDLEPLYVAAGTAFGLLFGSFLNVCIYRIPRDLSVVAPRSFCPECGERIAWHDNLPLLSYAVLRGRCRACGKQIGLRYPIVELSTAILFAAVAIRYGWTVSALKWALFEALVIALFWTDIEERLLPDELTLGGAVLGFLVALFVRVPGELIQLFVPSLKVLWLSLFSAGVSATVLAGPIWILGFVYARVRGREGLGLGDVKLLVLLGVFLGLENGLLALLIGVLSGSVIGIVYIWLAQKKASTYELPFGSFLCAGAALVPLMHRL
jgi:leader peptidase (prepilin peptidase) / N-methyltransferase